MLKYPPCDGEIPTDYFQFAVWARAVVTLKSVTLLVLMALRLVVVFQITTFCMGHKRILSVIMRHDSTGDRLAKQSSRLASSSDDIYHEKQNRSPRSHCASLQNESRSDLVLFSYCFFITCVYGPAVVFIASLRGYDSYSSRTASFVSLERLSETTAIV